MSIVLDGTQGITTPELDSGPVAGSTANFSGNVTLGTSVLETPVGAAPSYTCRAWVNFDGTTSPGTIRGSGNVSSVTRYTTGGYRVNFATAMPDANYSIQATPNRVIGGSVNMTMCVSDEPAPNTTQISLRSKIGHTDANVNISAFVSIFR